MRELLAAGACMLVTLAVLPWLRMDVPESWAISRDCGTVLLASILLWAVVQIMRRCLWG